MIWKRFMQRALPYLQKEPEGFASPESAYGAAEWVVQRDGRIQRDNGLCNSRHLVVYFPGDGPSRTANCKENEVDVPNVLGVKLRKAKERLSLVPLRAKVVYRQAFPGEPAGVVVQQKPRKGRMSSYGRVVLVVGRR
jgi:hypothetical protein